MAFEDYEYIITSCCPAVMEADGWEPMHWRACSFHGLPGNPQRSITWRRPRRGPLNEIEAGNDPTGGFANPA